MHRNKRIENNLHILFCLKAAGVAFPACCSLAHSTLDLASSISFQVGLQSTMLKTQCLCNHLTFFSSDFFVLPRTVDVENTIKLLLHVTSNPVGVSLLASLLGFYLLLGTWAWRKDRADLQKVRRPGLQRPPCLECVELDGGGGEVGITGQEQRHLSGVVLHFSACLLSQNKVAFFFFFLCGILLLLFVCLLSAKVVS